MDPITGFIINLIVGVVLSVASTLLSQAFNSTSQQQRTATGMRGSAVSGGKVPKYFLIGTVGSAGKVEYPNEWGSSGGAPNAYAVDVISFGDLPISAMPKFYVNGVETTVSETGHVTQGYPVTGDKEDYLWLEKFDGTQTTASSYLTDKFGSDADRPWTSDMVGVGIPYIIATTVINENKWTKSHQNFVMECQGIPLYDPREDTTAGGSGSQRWNDQSTWAFSDNSMVIIYNILRGIYYDGELVWGGGTSEAQLPYDVWSAAMDACDESVSLEAGGSEKRFRGGRKISFNERPADVITEFLIGANSRISYCADGTVYVLVGIPDEADGSFTDDDVIATNNLGTIPFPNLDDVINGGTATFIAPETAWEDKETSAYYRSDLETKDDGRQQLRGLSLETTFSGTQAQRVVQATIEEGRRFRRHVVALPPEFAVYRPLQILAWTSSRFDYTAKFFLITVRTLDPFGNVIFGLQEVDPDDHDWTPGTDEKPINYAPVVTNAPAPQEVSGFSVAPATVQDSDGTNRRPGIDVFWSSTSVAIDVESVRVTIATDDGAGGADTTVIDAPAIRPEVGSARFAGDPLLQNQDYVVQIQYIPRSGRETTASAWLQVTTPIVGLTNSDMSAEVNAYRQAGARELDRLRREVGNLALTTGAMDMRNRSQIAVVTDQAFAAVTVESEARVTADEAFASQLTTTISEFNDSFAGTLFKMESIAAADGWDARIAFMVRAGTGDSFAQGGLYMDAKTSGETRMFADFDKFLVRGQMVSVNNVKSIDWDTGDESTIIPDP